MTFLAPARLWLAALPLALLAAYVVVQRLRRRDVVRFTNVELLASVAPRRPGWRRHVPAAGLLLGLLLLTVGFARPAAPVRVPRERATVILALDVSESMRADDVRPNRLAAAQEAARDFATDLPQPLRLGLVTFSGSASLVVAPTTDRQAVVDAIGGLRLGPRTAIGEAIFASLSAIATDDGEGKTPAQVVLMSDGATTSGRPNAEAAEAARAAGTPVTTIAYGTDEGTVTIGDQIIPVPVDSDSLRDIAQTTGGRFFEAADADSLDQVYDDIGSAVGYRTERREVTTWFVGFALLATCLAAAGSLVWSSRLP